ncbi:hypothetical protein GCM10023169_29610 [Georgenia halophila]|uniref:Uncharacterized protein n=1 Tax=Georgenia halophila TaxID=620889 RepID=A0ABP8LFN7_9MICO
MLHAIGQLSAVYIRILRLVVPYTILGDGDRTSTQPQGPSREQPLSMDDCGAARREDYRQ